MGQPGDSEENFCDSEVEVVFQIESAHSSGFEFVYESELSTVESCEWLKNFIYEIKFVPVRRIKVVIFEKDNCVIESWKCFLTLKHRRAFYLVVLFC